MHEKQDRDAGARIHARAAITLVGFLLVAGFFLWTEHRAHLIGVLTEHKSHIWEALPYLLFLLCPFLHLFMHRGHGGGHAGHEGHGLDRREGGE